MSLLTNALNKLPINARRLLETAVLGAAAGLMAVLFLESTNWLFKATFGELAKHSGIAFTLGSFALIMTSSIIVSLLLKFAPSAAGSGIPQLKVAYWKELGFIPWKPILVKFIAGVISLGGGASLGREGPTLYLCGGLTSSMAGYFGKPKRGRREALTIGAAAGLAAAFNTPLAAITFILEELVGDLSNRYLGVVVLAAVMGALVVQACLGPQPSFVLPVANSTTWELYLAAPIAALLATACGITFEKTTLRMRQKMSAQKMIPKWTLPIFGGLLTWCVAISVYLGTSKIGIFGLGYGDLSDALANGISWKLAGVLMTAKIVSTLFSYSFGGCGGIFSPTLFIGGMSGFFVAGVGSMWLPLTSSDHIILAGVGMCSCLCAVIRAPLTSLLIVFEMTHEFALVPPLMIGIIICEGVARLFGNQNFYTSLLLQDGHELIKINPPRDLQSWRNIKAEQIMNPKAVCFESLDFSNAREILRGNPFRCFPVKKEGVLTGIVSRDELKKYLKSGIEPFLEQPVTCHSEQTIQEISDRFIQSPSGFLIVMDETGRRVLGVLTLHDLLRAQTAVMEN
jgi:CIC family chloride channel protein